jgi:uncharacterized protein YjbJ (UPF0337 family)
VSPFAGSFAAGKYFHCKKFHVRVKHLPEPSRSFDAFPAKTKATCRHSDCVPIIPQLLMQEQLKIKGEETRMNQDQVSGKWKQLKGQIKAKWGKMTDDDLTEAEGDMEKLAGRIQERTGDSKENIRNWLNSQNRE